MFAFLSETEGKANSHSGGRIAMIRALGPGSVSSFLKVILDVAYYVLWFFLVVVAIGALGLLLVSFDPQILPSVVRIHVDAGGPQGGALQLTGVGLYVIGVIVIVQRLRRVFGTMTAGDPFHPDNVRRLRVIGMVLALLEIDRYVFGALDRFVLHSPSHGSGLNLTAWFAVLVIVVLAEVFREGARLRRDAELTI
jgi:hypothetical protein